MYIHYQIIQLLGTELADLMTLAPTAEHACSPFYGGASTVYTGHDNMGNQALRQKTKKKKKKK